MSEGNYDVVIIGAGLGGLLCGVMLAKEGMKVCILEKNRQIGGCLQTFAFQKKVFDACVHYIGGLGEGHTLNRIFGYAGIMDKLRLQSLDPHAFDEILLGGNIAAYPIATREYFEESLLPFFPRERAALRSYLDLISRVARQFPLYDLKPGDASGKTAVSGLELMSTLRGLTANEDLVRVLAGNNLLYAGVEGMTPFYTHAMSIDGYLHSAHKVLPGSSQIARFLWRELQAHGGEVVRNSEVGSMHESEGSISHVTTKDGREWRAGTFIAAIHPSILFSLTDSAELRPAFRKRVSSLPHTPAAVMINLALKPATLPYPARNVYWHPSGEVVAKAGKEGIVWPDTQALYYAPDDANSGFAESVSLLAYARDQEFAAWTTSKNISGIHVRRQSDYVAKKEEVASILLAKTYDRFPELKHAVTAHSLATPLSFRDYTGTPGGSLYGPLKAVERPGLTNLSVRTRISNLLLTGQNVNMHGVMGVSLTAVATCSELLGMEYLLKRIREHGDN